MAEDFRFSQDWFSPRAPILSRILRPLRERRGVRILEIGVFEGRATVWLLENVAIHPTDTIDCVDPFSWSPDITDGDDLVGLDMTQVEGRFWHNVRQVGAADRVRLLTRPSAEALCDLPASSYDLIYVDGSHQAADVLTDAVHSYRLVKPGGLIAFDDYGLAEYFGAEPSSKDPLMAVDSFIACFDRRIEVLHRDYQVIVQRRY